jgi:diguanylate cyclase (GGDEF)-like protein/PAS domain S-box-containing protein
MVIKNSVLSSQLPDSLGPAWFEKCINRLNDAIIITEAEPIDSPGPRILWANDVFYELTGYQASEVIGKSPRILQGPLTDRSELKKLRSALEKWQDCRIEVLNYKKDGSTFWNQFEVTPIANEAGYYTHWISVQRDVSARRRLEEQVKQSEERYGHAIHGANVGIFDWDRLTDSVYYSPIWKSMLGYQESEIGNKVAESLKLLHPDDRDFAESVFIDFIKGESKLYDIEFRMRHKKGHYLHLQSHASAITDKSGKVIRIVGTHVDISKRKKAEEKLKYQSSHDDLTGLLNRREFERRANELLEKNELDDALDKDAHALCYIDLDQFKVVNDTCGHAAGDELLRQLSIALQKVIPVKHTLARLGGDEFGVLMANCSIDSAHQIASHIQEAIQDYQFIFEGQRFRVSASIGLVPIIGSENTLISLLKDADAACYMAKDSGRNRIHVYHIDDEDLSQRHGEMQWVTRIQKALSENRFCLYAQSIESLKNNHKMHYELLLRMQDEQGRIIPPGAFLPAAERYNLILQLDRWVIENAFRLLQANPTFLDKIEFISINLSGHSLTDESILLFMIAKFKEYKIDGNKICFEITETAAISNLSRAENFILKLKALGCKFALDDFGSGLSSFGYLKNLPVDYLKIDGTFVKDMVDDKIDYAMVKSINEIGHIMSMQTIAEFVESPEIIKLLRELSVDYAQGYTIHKPQPFQDILKL